MFFVLSFYHRQLIRILYPVNINLSTQKRLPENPEAGIFLRSILIEAGQQILCTVVQYLVKARLCVFIDLRHPDIAPLSNDAHYAVDIEIADKFKIAPLNILPLGNNGGEGMVNEMKSALEVSEQICTVL